MHALAYYVALPVLWLISVLPFWLLYPASDVARVVLFHVVRYRRRVIRGNIARAFPEWHDRRRARLERDFYRHFVDLIFETIKERAMSHDALARRVTTDDATIALLQRLRRDHGDAIAVMGHMGNWEWAGGAYDAATTTLRMAVLYAPLHQRRFDQLLTSMRVQHGMIPIPSRQALRTIPASLGRGMLFLFIADQSPHPRRAYWTTFLHQETAIFRGPEHFARAGNLPVVYFTARKPRRGHYHVTAELLAEPPFAADTDAITERFTRRLEEDVRAQPEIWLWSHRRWKHRRPAP